jgi:catechol 2,3-dioxygenase-like lactoylglutathione lyase family enzyme
MLLLITLLLATAIPGAQTKQTETRPAAESKVRLTHTCIITQDVKRLTVFYERVLQIAPRFYGDDYAEFSTEAGVLAVFSARAQEAYIPGSTDPARNRSIVLEFRVDDVDKEYARLQKTEIVWVKPPTTQAWGNRSIYFRDPDGNLVNFYARVSPGS